MCAVSALQTVRTLMCRLYIIVLMCKMLFMLNMYMLYVYESISGSMGKK